MLISGEQLSNVSRFATKFPLSNRLRRAIVIFEHIVVNMTYIKDCLHYRIMDK